MTQWAAGSAALADVERLLPLVRFPLMCAQEMQVRLACERPLVQNLLMNCAACIRRLITQCIVSHSNK